MRIANSKSFEDLLAPLVESFWARVSCPLSITSVKTPVWNRPRREIRVAFRYNPQKSRDQHFALDFGKKLGKTWHFFMRSRKNERTSWKSSHSPADLSVEQNRFSEQRKITSLSPKEAFDSLALHSRLRLHRSVPTRYSTTSGSKRNSQNLLLTLLLLQNPHCSSPLDIFRCAYMHRNLV
jgi:hypothetical protein